mgnify:CR=1 FL=1
MQPFYGRMAENKDGGNLARHENAVLRWTASEKTNTIVPLNWRQVQKMTGFQSFGTKKSGLRTLKIRSNPGDNEKRILTSNK